MLYKGNVVQFGHKDDLYIIVDIVNDVVNSKVSISKVHLIPIKGENVSVHLSRKNPIKSMFKIYAACIANDCGHEEGCCPYDTKISDFNVDNLHFVSSDVYNLIHNSIDKMIIKSYIGY